VNVTTGCTANIARSIDHTGFNLADQGEPPVVAIGKEPLKELLEVGRVPRQEHAAPCDAACDLAVMPGRFVR
jgi:hypothetical protein